MEEDLSKQSASSGSEGKTSKPVIPEMDCTSLTNECIEDNSKENLPTPEGEIDIAAKLIKQCEFYFCDSNILKDPFLFNKLKDSPDGYIKLSVIENFKRMQSLCQDHNVIVAALKQSPELEITEDGEMIRRRRPLPKWDPDVCLRTLIIANYGSEKAGKARTEAMFEDFQSAPVMIRIRRLADRLPSDVKPYLKNHPPRFLEIFTVVEFETIELAEAAKLYAQAAKPNFYIEILGAGMKTKKWTVLPKRSSMTSGASVAPTTTVPIPSKFSLNRFRVALTTSKNSERVELIREPLAPPNESATGFTPGWRKMLTSQRQEKTDLNRLCLGASPAESSDPTSQCFMDPAIVAIGPALVSAQQFDPMKCMKPLSAAAEPFFPTNKAAAS